MDQQVNTGAGSKRPVWTFGSGALIGTLGGLIGLGGAEFRLPLLIGVFRFAALEAVILNKAMSLVVVASALPFRAATVPFSAIAANWLIIVYLLCGSLLGAWLGASWAVKMKQELLYRIIAVFLVVIALVLLCGHDATAPSGPSLSGIPLAVAGVVAGFAIGAVAARYSRDGSFAVIGRNKSFLLVMAAGSLVGAFIGGLLLGIVPSAVLLPMLATILFVSALKVWQHR